jgi:hypothetical protein
VTVTTTVPSAEQVMELHQFVQDRNEEEFRHAIAAPPDVFTDTAAETVRRLSNCTKLSVAATAAYLLACLNQHQNEQAARLWDTLTTCGEQWQDHTRWKPQWGNHARATLLDDLRKS